MIPRLRPPFALLELYRAFLTSQGEAEYQFERALAGKFGFPYALFFPYGRSALYAFLKALGWHNHDILVPAYTCAVVPHAIVKSGNRVRFVDCQPDHFNVAPADLSQALDSHSSMVILTPLFGYPLDRAGCEEAVAAKAPRALILYDAAHSFGLEDEGGYQFREADAVLLGFGIGKLMTTLYGGALLLKDAGCYELLREFRNLNYSAPNRWVSLGRLLYGLAVWGAFREPIFSFVAYLEENTKLLYRFSEYYYGKDYPSLPDDVTQRPPKFQAKLGQLQLRAYDSFIAQRRKIAAHYEKRLTAEGFTVFSWRFRPTYSHFPMTVACRDQVVTYMRRRGVQLGSLIDYACPELPGYEAYRGQFPRARAFGQSMINLPNWPGLSQKHIEYVVTQLCRCRDNHPTWFDSSHPSH